MSTEEIERLIKESQSGNPKKQREAIFELNELEAVEAIPVFIDLLLSDPDKTIRADVAFLLSSLGDQQPQPEALGPALLQALDDEDGSVRTTAAEALGDLQYHLAVQRLRKMLHSDPVWFGRSAAAEALGKLADEASIPDLQSAMTDPDPKVQRYVVIALGKFLDVPTVAPFIATSLSGDVHDPTVKAELLALSYRLGHHSHIHDLLALLEQNEDYEQVTALIEVLLDLTDPQLRVSIPQRDKDAILTTLQGTQLLHPSFLTDIERIRRNLN